VEDLRSGVRKLFHYCPLYLNDKKALPIMEEDDVFKLTIRYEKEGASNIIGTEKVNVSTNTDKVFALIQENPKITAYELMSELSLSERGVRKILAHLVELNIIERKGSKRNGEWVIIQE
jgi:ATP-dependent DNA helicase RecG